MTDTADNTRSRLYCLLYFDTWDARRHCVNCLNYYGCKGYMYSIDPVAEFLTSVDLTYTGWFHADVVDGGASGLVCANISSIAADDLATVPYPLILSFDIECYSDGHQGMPRSYRHGDAIVMIGVSWCRYKDNGQPRARIIINRAFLPQDYVPASNAMVCDDEVAMIRALASLVKDVDPTVVVGYNISGFDVPYIHDRLLLRLVDLPDLSRTHRQATSVTDVDWYSSAYGHNVMRRLCIEGRVVMDLYLLFKRRRDLESASLSEVSKVFLGDDKVDLGTSHMFEMLSNPKQQHIDDISLYCLKDTTLVLDLINALDCWVSWVEESRAARVSIDELYTRGTGVRINNQLYYECYYSNTIMVESTSSKGQYEGAIAFDPPRGRFENCSCVDFRSLYPSIMIQYNICTSTYVDTNVADDGCHTFLVNGNRRSFRRHPVGVIPGLLRKLLDRRAEVRREMATVTDGLHRSILNERQNMLKINANAIYGVMGSKESKYLRHHPCSETVTYIGRTYITWLRDYIINHYGIDVPYGDTDSSYLHCPSMSTDELVSRTKTIVSEINDILPDSIKLAYEAHYDVVLFLTKKRYIMCSGDKITNKGVVTARRGVCKYAKDVYANVLRIAMTRGTTAGDILCYLEGAYKRLVRGQVAIGDLMISRAMRKEYSNPSVPQSIMLQRLRNKGVKVAAGTRLQFLYVKSNETKQGYKMYTREEVEADGLEIDVVYYLQRQITKAIGDLLHTLGYDGVESMAYCRAINSVMMTHKGVQGSF
jgi:DNA polymerase delta subunit 1